MIHEFNQAGISKLRGPKRHVRSVTSHVTQSARAEIKPTTPRERMINACLVRANRGRSQPQVPFEICWYWIFARRSCNALRPDGPIGPDMDLFNRPNHSSVHDFNRPTQPFFRAALVTHLCDYSMFFCQVSKVPGFEDGLRQRLLAINMFAHFDGSRGDNRVQMVRS